MMLDFLDVRFFDKKILWYTSMMRVSLFRESKSLEMKKKKKLGVARSFSKNVGQVG